MGDCSLSALWLRMVLRRGYVYQTSIRWHNYLLYCGDIVIVVMLPGINQSVQYMGMHFIVCAVFPLQMASAELSSNQVQINKGILNGSNPLGVEVLGERAIIWVTTYCLKS
jgi:hypothetical protein